MAAEVAKGLWEDPDFPANSTILRDCHKTAFDIKWLRPKDICANPQFIVGGTSRFDASQGSLGNCWVIAAMACVAKHIEQFKRCVIPDQGFDKNYTGKFIFRFWDAGEWKEYPIDDRLPVKMGRMLYARNEIEPNEFWVPLLEKAYAKFHGSYQNLCTGYACNALVNITGGVSQSIDMDLPDVVPDLDRDALFSLLSVAMDNMSMVACDIRPPDKTSGPPKDYGWVYFHEYSVTDVRELQIDNRRIRLVRLRNPWGRYEWKGKWSDNCPEWNTVPANIKKDLGLLVRDDGEFWLSFEDFVTFHRYLRFCHFTPEPGESDNKWKLDSFKGTIEKGSPRNSFKHTTSVPTITDKEGKPADVHVVISLLQTEKRLWNDLQLMSIDMCPAKGGHPLKPVKIKQSWDNLREVTAHYLVPADDYVIFPNTARYPDRNVDYLLRVLVERSFSDHFLHIR